MSQGGVRGAGGAGASRSGGQPELESLDMRPADVADAADVVVVEQQVGRERTQALVGVGHAAGTQHDRYLIQVGAHRRGDQRQVNHNLLPGRHRRPAASPGLVQGEPGRQRRAHRNLLNPGMLTCGSATLVRCGGEPTA